MFSLNVREQTWPRPRLSWILWSLCFRCTLQSLFLLRLGMWSKGTIVYYVSTCTAQNSIWLPFYFTKTVFFRQNKTISCSTLDFDEIFMLYFETFSTLMWSACPKKSYLTNLEVWNLKSAVSALCGCLSFACFEKKWGKVSWIFQNSSIRHITNTFSYDMPTTLHRNFKDGGS